RAGILKQRRYTIWCWASSSIIMCVSSSSAMASTALQPLPLSLQALHCSPPVVFSPHGIKPEQLEMDVSRAAHAGHRHGDVGGLHHPLLQLHMLLYVSKQAREGAFHPEQVCLCGEHQLLIRRRASKHRVRLWGRHRPVVCSYGIQILKAHRWRLFKEEHEPGGS